MKSKKNLYKNQEDEILSRIEEFETGKSKTFTWNELISKLRSEKFNAWKKSK